MSQWNGVHTTIKAIQKDASAEFQVDITQDVLREAVNGLIECRLSEVITEKFDEMSTHELLIAQQILQTDQNVMEKVAAERVKSGKKKGDLN